MILLWALRIAGSISGEALAITASACACQVLVESDPRTPHGEPGEPSQDKDFEVFRT
jgi:hypothetical protein